MLEAGASSVTYRDAEDKPILEPGPGETPVWDNSIVTGLFESDADTETLISQLALGLDAHAHSISTERLEDQDWERSWLAYFKPMHFGGDLWVVPTHMDPPQPSAVNLKLDPGLAFGTGTHPTTSLCLQWLSAHPPQDMTVLDYGCGSGILAIASLLFGARQADGTDIDPQAIEASLSNADINDVRNGLGVYLVKDFERREYDLVLANILSGPLAQLAPELAACCRAGGNIVLSGLLREQAADISEIYAEYFDMSPPRFLGDWALLHGCRTS